MGYSRDSFYRFKERYETGGEDALREIRRRKPTFGTGSRVIARRRGSRSRSISRPGQHRVGNELAKQGRTVSPAGVGCVWVRQDLVTMKQRLKALQAKAAQDGRILTEAQLAALERVQLEKERTASSTARVRATAVRRTRSMSAR